MIAFEISVNGKKICVAATSPNLVLATGLTWTHREPDRLSFNIGGIPDGDDGNHHDWDVPAVGVGDEITIRIIETESPDEPDRVYHPAENIEARSPE